MYSVAEQLLQLHPIFHGFGVRSEAVDDRNIQSVADSHAGLHVFDRVLRPSWAAKCCWYIECALPSIRGI
jgi:hypothetical protein